MLKNLFFITLFVAASGSQSVVFGQQAQLDSLKRKFNQYREVAFQEKLYVHVSQNVFLTGETLWFKVYAVDATLHKPVDVSKVAYVELLDANKKPVLQGKVKISEEGGNGSFFIPATLASGNYILRAYTQWMRNFSPDFYFTRKVTLVNPFISPESETKAVAPKVHVEFFPEGGNLVAGIKSKVGFKISNASDDSSLKGFVVNSSNETVATFTPLKFGLGHFYLTPSHEKYSCVIDDSKGNKYSFPLPTVEPEGYVMHLSDSSDNRLYVKVTTKGGEGQPIYLFAHTRQMVAHVEMKPAAPEAVFAIDRNKLPEGVSHLTVFDQQLRPMCERIFFKPSSGMNLKINASQASYLPRTKVSLEINADVAHANLSVSVFRVDSLSTTDQAGILSYLMLSSELKGHIESPEYYFSNDPLVREATENLMLTHGWRRFNWSSILNKKYTFDIAPEFRSHIVKGKIFGDDGKPVKSAIAFVASPSKLVQLGAARSNDSGIVFFEMSDFWGPRKLVAQLNNQVDSTLNISITDPFSSDHGDVSIPPFQLSKDVEQDLKLRSVAMQVQDIYFRDQSEKIMNEAKSDSTSFFGKTDKAYLLDDYTRFPLLEEVMREYVPEVFVRKRKDKFHFMVVNSIQNRIFPEDPLVLLDGVPVFDLNKIMSFDPRLIKKLEVITRYFYLGPMRINGIVSYSTYQGNLQGFELDPRAVVIDYEGLQLNREFYSPKYENAKQRNSKLPDQRTLLFWQPTVVIDASGKQTLEFYSSDVSGKFIAAVEGMAPNGSAGGKSTTFTVNNEEF